VREPRDSRVLLEATVLKRRMEARELHRILTEAGIPEDLANDGVRSCLLARVMALADRAR
jgi:hypothetical protein